MSGDLNGFVRLLGIALSEGRPGLKREARQAFASLGAQAAHALGISLERSAETPSGGRESSRYDPEARSQRPPSPERK